MTITALAQYEQEESRPHTEPLMSCSHDSPHLQPSESILEKHHIPPHAAPTSSTSGKLKYHPFSLALIVFWMFFIITTIALLERSVTVAPTTLVLPWYYSNDGLPNVLTIIFVQAHGPITAMHLSRLAMSALQSSIGAPSTWMELFWLSDKSWSGPVGIVTTSWTVMSSRIRISFAFVLFSLITLTTVATPLVLNRAYPIKILDVTVPETFFPNTLTPSKLAGIDAYAQMAAGGGAWITNQSAISLFNRTTYIPVGQPRGDTSYDYFFAGDAQNLDVRLPGIRLQGGCVSQGNQTNLSQPNAFQQYCQNEFGSIGDYGATILAANSLSLNMSMCSNIISFQPLNQSQTSNSTALIWFENTNSTGMLIGDLVTGLVRCDALAHFGNASLQGQSIAFDDFVPDNLYNPSQAGEPLLDPIAAVLYYLLNTAEENEVLQAGPIDELGYAESGIADGLFYTSPSLDGFANAMWNGITQMTNSMEILARSSDISYEGIAHVAVSGRTRDEPFFVGAIFLLVVWLVGVMSATVLLFRPTVCSSLGSYAAARLLAERPDLLEGEKVGTADQNQRLLESFKPVKCEESDD